jgi:hypothetical protein
MRIDSSRVRGVSAATMIRTGEDEATGGTGNRALDEEKSTLGINRVNLEVEDSDTIETHTTGHAHALEDARRGRRSTDRTGLAVVSVRTVRCGNTLEVVTLHNTGETFTFGRSDDVDTLARGEKVNGQFLSEVVVGCIRGADFGDVANTRCVVRRLKVEAEGKSGFRISCDAEASAIPAFIKRLQSAGLRDLLVEAASLEEAFMSYYGNSTRNSVQTAPETAAPRTSKRRAPAKRATKKRVAR